MRKVSVLLILCSVLSLSSFGMSANGMTYSSVELTPLNESNFRTLALANKDAKVAEATKIAEAAKAPEPVVAKEMVINFTGDICLARNYGKLGPEHTTYENKGAQYFLNNVRPILESDDFTVVNLENVFTDSTTAHGGKQYTYKSSPKYFDILTKSSIEVMGLMNNHSHDYNQKGLDDTIALVKKNGITPIGFNARMTPSYPELGDVKMDMNYIMNANGIKVGILNYMAFIDHDPGASKVNADVKALKAKGAEYIIAYVHWGNNDQLNPTVTQKKRGKEFIDNGVDLIVGHHAHILQPMEEYKGKRIYYSLGNFLFFGYNSMQDNLTFVLNLKLTKNADGKIVETFNHIPMQWTGKTTTNVYQPSILTGDSAVTRLAKRIGIPKGEVTSNGSYFKSPTK